MTLTLLGISEVSELTRVPESTLRWYRAAGIGPKSFKVGRRVRYRYEDCLEWITAQEAHTAVGGVK